MLLLAAAELGLILFAQPDAVAATSWPAARILAIQVVVSAVFYALYFRLQHLAGPVYLSQIGYVGTAFALPIAVLVFGDRVTPAMIAGVALVILGVFLVRPATNAKAKQRSPVSPGPSEVVGPPHAGGVQ